MYLINSFKYIPAEKFILLNLANLFLLSVIMTNNSWGQIISSPVVQVNMLEVYTSQGCSSCPPAERWMSTFKQDERLWKQLVPMNFHVDYWDYLGWKDPYASSVFTQRQRDYKALKLSTTVATPGFMYSGMGWNGWFRGRSVPVKPYKAIGVLSAEFGIADKDQKNRARIQFNPVIDLPTQLQVHVAVLGFDQITQVPRGENSGKKLPHDFVVLAYNRGELNLDKGTFNSELKIPDASQFTSAKQALVFWVSEQGNPTPIQVAANWW